ncbi:MBL fold metallo-hydrolase [Bdellovibrio sp. HCB337]|uniref:MBL fold metallo-hydrolase n=1 Tax=Bdellovibrio sp. HCB337 TaxID=3394358 RepID=UPI0039A420DD
MKWVLLSLLSFTIFLGCQNFRYYDPAKPHRSKDQFLNNYDNSPKSSVWKWQWERLTTNAPPEPPFQPEILKTDTAALSANRDKTSFTWVGHSTALLQLEGVNVLIDPVFSERVSPVSFFGPKREVPLPFELAALPPIDVVLISHAHYDHLDLPTLKALYKRAPEKTLFLVPLGIQSLLQSEGLKNVQEVDWWEQKQIQNLTMTFTPAQHWTRRGLFDTNQTLWGGWFVAAKKFKFFFAGDTGYSKDFKDIQARLGDVDLAMLPIGAYAPRWFMQKNHVNPEEAVQIHEDLHAKLSIGVHWGTFRLSDEPMAKPAEDLQEALNKKSISGTFRVMKHGESIYFPNTPPF